MFKLLNDLKEYNLKNLDKIKSKEETIINAKKLYKNRNNVLRHLKMGFFHLMMDFKKKKRARYV